MEMFGLAVLLVAVAAYYGLFDILEVGARMGTREIKDLERDQKSKMMHKAAARKIDDKEYKAAIANNTMIDGYDL